MVVDQQTLPFIAILGGRAEIERVRRLIEERLEGKAQIFVPDFLEGLPSIMSRKPAAVVLASEDASWAAMALRGMSGQVEATFVVTARPEAFNGLLPQFPNAKFFDGTTVAPLENWYTSGMLAEQLLAAIPTQEPV